LHGFPPESDNARDVRTGHTRSALDRRASTRTRGPDVHAGSADLREGVREVADLQARGALAHGANRENTLGRGWERRRAPGPNPSEATIMFISASNIRRFPRYASRAFEVARSAGQPWSVNVLTSPGKSKPGC
jgi:hypothetical protein